MTDTTNDLQGEHDRQQARLSHIAGHHPLDTFTKSYLAAVRADVVDSAAYNATHELPMIPWVTVADYYKIEQDLNDSIQFSAEALIRAQLDCLQFQIAMIKLFHTHGKSIDHLLNEPAGVPTGECSNRNGYDFYMTRVGHGVGFWERSDAELGQQLADLARSFKGIDAYVGDNSLIYFM